MADGNYFDIHGLIHRYVQQGVTKTIADDKGVYDPLGLLKALDLDKEYKFFGIDFSSEGKWGSFNSQASWGHSYVNSVRMHEAYKHVGTLSRNDGVAFGVIGFCNADPSEVFTENGSEIVLYFVMDVSEMETIEGLFVDKALGKDYANEDVQILDIRSTVYEDIQKEDSFRYETVGNFSVGNAALKHGRMLEYDSVFVDWIAIPEPDSGDEEEYTVYLVAYKKYQF